jgi:hypothetical protein
MEHEETGNKNSSDLQQQLNEEINIENKILNSDQSSEADSNCN